MENYAERGLPELAVVELGVFAAALHQRVVVADLLDVAVLHVEDDGGARSTARVRARTLNPTVCSSSPSGGRRPGGARRPSWRC